MKSIIYKTALIAGVSMLASSAFAGQKNCNLPPAAKQQISHMPTAKKQKITKTFKQTCIRTHKIKYDIHAKKAMLNAVLVQPNISKKQAHKLANDLSGLYKQKIMVSTNARIKLHNMGLKFVPHAHKKSIKHRK